jgi:hypothetical protein
MPQDADDPLHELRDRIAETKRAAERLAGEVPPSGWATPGAAKEHSDELTSLVQLVAALRDLVPPELRDQVNDVLRAVLLLLRAVIDWLTAQLDEPSGPPPPQRDVQDIPIA